MYSDFLSLQSQLKMQKEKKVIIFLEELVNKMISSQLIVK